MAVLKQLPHQAIIDGFKGKVDFYLWKGIPCARMWPHWPKRDPTDPERAAQQSFAYITKAAAQLPEYIVDQYRRMAVGTPWTWRDLLTRSYLQGLGY